MIRSIVKTYFQGIVYFWCNSYKIILPLSRILMKMKVTHSSNSPLLMKENLADTGSAAYQHYNGSYGSRQ